MSKKYQIRPGESFRDSDDTVKGGGQLIELCDEMAVVHRDKITPVPDELPVDSAVAQTSGDLPAHEE